MEGLLSKLAEANPRKTKYVRRNTAALYALCDADPCLAAVLNSAGATLKYRFLRSQQLMLPKECLMRLFELMQECYPQGDLIPNAQVHEKCIQIIRSFNKKATRFQCNQTLQALREILRRKRDPERRARNAQAFPETYEGPSEKEIELRNQQHLIRAAQNADLLEVMTTAQ